MEAQSPPSKLPRRALNNGKSAGSVSYGLTLMQLQELKQQSLIYNYIKAGIPVPTYLILPIWKSFPSSISNRFYPNLAVFNYNRKNSMESEPGRCRRTDGKKWRCNKNVVQGQKYCHRHLHRGRLRSEHHLQPPSAAATATTTTT